MNSRYKVLISNKNLYKEVELAADAKQVKVGTAIDCDFRLRKELFFDSIELTFTKNNDVWSVFCSDNLYLTVGDVRKLVTMTLKHGDYFEVRYQGSNNLVFSLEFFIDFDNGNLKYERKINISGRPVVSIGANGSNDIILKSDYIKNDSITLTNKNQDLVLNIKNTTFGVYHNGNKAHNNEIIKNGDFISMADFSFYYKDGYLMTEANASNTTTLPYDNELIPDNYPKFNRNNRIKTVVDSEGIEILDPPAKPKKPKNNIFMRLLPSFGMLLAAGIMAFMGGMMIIMSVISGVMAIFTTIVGIKESNKDYKTESSQRIEKYNAYIDSKKTEIKQFRSKEENELSQIFISQNQELENVNYFSSDLFDRKKSDEDYLCIRLGIGDVVSNREIKYKKQERLEIEDELQMLPEQIHCEFEKVHNAPIVCDLKEINALGIVGNMNYRENFLNNIVLDLVTRQYYSDLKLIFVSEFEHKEITKLFRFLPHVYNETLGVRNIVCDIESKNQIFEYLYKELTVRENNKSFDSNLVVIFYDEFGFKSHPISKYITKARELGVTFIFFENSVSDVPQGCDKLVNLSEKSKGNIVDVEDGSRQSTFEYNIISFEQMKNVVYKLAPVYTEEISLESTLTKNISLFDLLNIISVDDIDLEKRWNSSQVFKSMAAPLGVSKTGTVYLDLHDKAHGPHGLVAGTTGSGKSEILQTYVLAMATLFHPYEVGFVIIDFKGGGMVNQFKELPHLTGAITNIDGKEINRSLKSIKAELKKRQKLFAEVDVNHIDKYIRKFKGGEAKVPLPHLIIIVDEFAELKADQPEFMKELISAARIGRSLGVHLILATQKPSGQVNEQIWSNSRFKLCLKVQSKEDSNEVIKSPLASEIKEPGRAYLQVGNNEIFELFQSAYSGAPEKSDDVNVKEFALFNITDSGKRLAIYSQKKSKSDNESRTQLNSIVKYVAEYCNQNKVIKLPEICLPPLENNIGYISQKSVFNKYYVEIGIYDDPDNQYQGVYSIDLSCNNLMLIGSAQSGKTNILQSIIRSISEKYTPEEAVIYIIDFSSMTLKNFDNLSHVGGVVCPSEDEKLKNLFKLINDEIEERKEKLLAVGVSSFTAYKEAGKKDIPLLVLMIDNLTALKELYFQDDDELLNICREGLTVGICIIIANAHTAGIGYKYLSNFSARIALFCNDSNEYSALFDHCSERIDSIPGRCIIELEKNHFECQSYLAFEGEKEIERISEIKKYIKNVNEINGTVRAKRIPLIPASLTKGYMLEQFRDYMSDSFSIVAGLDYSTVTPYVMDFSRIGLLAVTGRNETGRHNWIKYSIDMLNHMYPKFTKTYIIDSIDKKLNDIKNSDNVVSYSVIPDDAVAFIKDIEMQVKDRYDALVSGDESIIEKSELLMLVIDNYDALLAICNDREALNSYKNITGRYKNMKVCIVAFVENASIPYSSPEIMKNIRDQHNMMYFDDMSNMKLFDVPLMISRKFKKPIEVGDGYYIRDNEVYKIKTPIFIGKDE